MATLSQQPLFGWDQIEALGELKRLQLVLENLPEEPVVKKLEQEQPGIVQRCREVAADRGYDDGKLIRELWDEWQAMPIIDIRNCCNDGEATKLVTGFENVVYDYRGTVSCVCPKSGTQHYGYHCAGAGCCELGKAVGACSLRWHEAV